jgi:predicted transcriptional regulator
MEPTMKSATFPSLRVDPALRRAAEEVLLDGESLSSFVEQSVRANIERRKAQDEFIARGLASRDKARRSGTYVSSGAVLKKLESRLTKAKAKAKPSA